MGDRLSSGPLRRAILLALCTGSAACAVPAAVGLGTAGAATITPASFTGCAGVLTPAPATGKGSKPNPLEYDYTFTCNGGISAYSIIADQQGDGGAALQDFGATPLVNETDDRTPSPTETISCEGTLPSDGINCNTGIYLGEVTADYYVTGSIELAQPYCKHLPTTNGKTDKPGTAAVPTADVQLIVTDWSGAQDGPFTLSLPTACPSVPNQVPAIPATARTTRKKTTSKKAASKKTTSKQTTTRPSSSS